MYVCELDRPWLGTPFLFQGFHIEYIQQIEELKHYCEYVYVDLSMGKVPPVLGRSTVVNKDGTSKRPASQFSERADQTAFVANESQNRSAKGKSQPYAQSVIIYDDKITVEEELKEAKQVFYNSQKLMSSLVQDIKNSHILDVGKVKYVIDSLTESVIRNPDALILLARLKDKDSNSYERALDVSVYLLAFGRQLGFPKEQLHILGMGGLLQDMGKMNLPSDLLDKKEKPSAAEYKVLRSHVLYSLDILNKMSGIPTEVMELVATHHERQDGSGYPNGLREGNIGIFGSMAAIVDCFSALTSSRPYAPTASPREALQILGGWKGKYLHGGLLERFIQCIGIYPVGSLVELNTGEVAIVLAQNKIYHLKPKIMIMLDPEKKPYKHPNILDLFKDPMAAGDKPYQIKRLLEHGMYGIDPKEYYL